MWSGLWTGTCGSPCVSPEVAVLSCGLHGVALTLIGALMRAGPLGLWTRAGPGGEAGRGVGVGVGPEETGRGAQLRLRTVRTLRTVTREGALCRGRRPDVGIVGRGEANWHQVDVPGGVVWSGSGSQSTGSGSADAPQRFWSRDWFSLTWIHFVRPSRGAAQSGGAVQHIWTDHGRLLDRELWRETWTGATGPRLHSDSTDVSFDFFFHGPGKWKLR